MEVLLEICGRVHSNILVSAMFHFIETFSIFHPFPSNSSYFPYLLEDQNFRDGNVKYQTNVLHVKSSGRHCVNSADPRSNVFNVEYLTVIILVTLLLSLYNPST